jgi:predicted nucleotidyltransferase
MKDAYIERVISACREVTGNRLEAAWVVGSLATGDFAAARSDLDLVVVLQTGVPQEAKAELAQALDHRMLACPAHGLDLIIYRERVLVGIPRAPEYEFSISTGNEWETDVSFGGPYPGGLIDLAASRQTGRSLHGPHPRDLVGAIPEHWILEELLASLRWHLDKVHDPFHDPLGSNAVLNACRALHYLVVGDFVSKSAGAEWFLRTRSVPVVAEALEGRLHPSRGRLDHTAVRSFLRQAIVDFESGTV